jgi:hypothetical protein
VISFFFFFVVVCEESHHFLCRFEGWGGVFSSSSSSRLELGKSSSNGFGIIKHIVAFTCSGRLAKTVVCRNLSVSSSS